MDERRAGTIGCCAILFWLHLSGKAGLAGDSLLLLLLLPPPPRVHYCDCASSVISILMARWLADVLFPRPHFCSNCWQTWVEVGIRVVNLPASLPVCLLLSVCFCVLSVPASVFFVCERSYELVYLAIY